MFGFLNLTTRSRISPVICLPVFFIFIQACSLTRQLSNSTREEAIGNAAKKTLLYNKVLRTAHVGISIFEPTTNTYWYEFQGEKYFVPASNTKIPTCYAAMKYLGDSLVGLQYGFSEPSNYKDTVLAFRGTGDPSFLHPDFANQPVLHFLQQIKHRPNTQLGYLDAGWNAEHWGSGWSWTDFDASYMAERSPLPVFGNLVEIKINPVQERNIKDTNLTGSDKIALFKTQTPFFDSLLNKFVNDLPREELLANEPRLALDRDFRQNKFSVKRSTQRFSTRSIPFITEGSFTAQAVIYNDLKIHFGLLLEQKQVENNYAFYYPDLHRRYIEIKRWHNVHSQPTDSLLKPMMHRSDNFFAEQSLLMVSNQKLGFMSDARIIDTLLKSDFKDLPQRPRWADGSGLSRYNLFTPQDFVFILNKMKNEFNMDRIKEIFPTGGEGTLGSFYKADSGYVYAKTGTLSGVVALSGYMYTRKNKLLIFSVLVNNHQAAATDVRRAVESFLQGIRNKY